MSMTTVDRSWRVLEDGAAPLTSAPDALRGTKVLVVGGTAGLGRAISRAMAARGADVTVVGRTFRDAEEGDAGAGAGASAGAAKLAFVRADLSLMAEARRVARELPAETYDAVVFTTGIFAAPKRQVTSEGLELDMAVSFLSRLVMLREMAPRLGASSATAARGAKPRVFVMGFPGAGQTGTLGDLNAEKSYAAMEVHMNTVAGNEALVHDAAKRYPNLAVFGLNPGLIQTGIRSNFLGEGSLKHRFVEWVLGLFTPTPETYAETVLPTMFAASLEARSGAVFDNKGRPALRSKGFDDERVAKFLGEAEAVLARAGQ